MSRIIGQAGNVTIIRLNSGLTAIDVRGGPGPYVTFTPDRWRDLTRAIINAKKRTAKDR